MEKFRIGFTKELWRPRNVFTSSPNSYDFILYVNDDNTRVYAVYFDHQLSEDQRVENLEMTNVVDLIDYAFGQLPARNKEEVLNILGVVEEDLIDIDLIR